MQHFHFNKPTFVTLIYLLTVMLSNHLASQPRPCRNVYASPNCEDAPLFCSLDELNGFWCNTLNGNGSLPCADNCSTGNQTSEIISWVSFISQGGVQSFTVTIGNCAFASNLPYPTVRWGIWGDCLCGDQTFCSKPCMVSTWPPTNVSQTFKVNLKPCKRYYLWITGCDGQYNNDGACNYTINTSPGGRPVLPTIDDINNIASGIIEPVCEGTCDYRLFVNPKGCEPNYEWTLNDVDLGKNSSEIMLDFPTEGDFKICVSTYIGDKKNGTICSRQGPKCAIVKVRRLLDRVGPKRYLCYEIMNGGNYKWHTQTIIAPGIYRESLADKNCCPFDSIVEFIGLPEPTTGKYNFISCDNQPYIDLLGRSHSLCKDHLYILLKKTTDPFKCDSFITLTAVGVYDSIHWESKCVGGKVELSPNFNIAKKCQFGESYLFEYKWYKKNDSLRTPISTNERLIVDAVNEDYCFEVKIKVFLEDDSVVCVKTYCDSINEAEFIDNTEDIKLSFCDSANINGQTYKQSTIFTQQLKNVFGCDSVIVTDLNIMKSNLTNLNFSGCDSVTVNNQLYTNKGIYKQRLTNTSGCDSILNLDISIGKSSQTNIALSNCDSIVVAGKTYTISGNYNLLLQGSSGCDSTVNLNLSIPKGSRERFSFDACDSVNFNGQTYKISGDYIQAYNSRNGCDSLLLVHVNITKSNNAPHILSLCDSANINGTKYFKSGIYTQLLTSANGCDSLLNIELTITKSNSSFYKFTSCDSALINGQWYLQSGKYIQLLQNTNQCDSTLNIDLNITKSSTGYTLFRSCDSIKINGIGYNQTGIYQQTLPNSNQCDSILVIDFTRLSKSYSALKYKSCDSVLVNNQVYKQSGQYTQILANANQCDSVLNLDIAIDKSRKMDINETACDSVLVNGSMYNQSGKFTQTLSSSEGCDSILNIDIIIQKSSQAEISQTDCDAIVINNQTYSQTGDYTQLLRNANLCDSLLTIHFTRLNASTSELAFTSCDSAVVNGKTYYQSGKYSQLLINSNGCDSTLGLDLIIKPGNPSTLEAGIDTSICEGELIQLNGIFSGAAKFTWQSSHGSFDNPNSITTNYYPSNIGNERIYLSATDDCKQWLDSLAILVFPRQIVHVTGDTIIDPCKEITFSASGGTNYIWTPTSLIDCLDPPCSKVKLKSFEETRFTITTVGPCVVPTNLNLSLSQIQSDIYIPNVFSPNGDNINDLFLPIFNCDAVTFFNLQIYDRWGNLLFESQNKEKGWNGKCQDVNLNPGVYPFVIHYALHGSERKLKTGDITLVR